MKDQTLCYLPHVSAIRRGARVKIVCRKTDLVIDDDMDCTSGTISLEARHLYHFVYDTLTRNRCVAMDKYRKNGVLVATKLIN